MGERPILLHVLGIPVNVVGGGRGSCRRTARFIDIIDGSGFQFVVWQPL